ncbi:unnamed protein product [Alopecurus aequalis]
MDDLARSFKSQLRRIKRDRVRLCVERDRLLHEQEELLRRRPDQTPTPRGLEARRIQSRLQDLEQKAIRLDNAEADVRRQQRFRLHHAAADVRSLSAQLGSSTSSSSRSTGSSTRVRQSVLYSARRGPRGRQGRPVEEHTGEVSSSEPAHTNTDLSQFEALTRNTTPPTLESADSTVVHASDIDSHEPDSTNAKKPAVQEGLSPSAVVHASDIDSHAPYSTNAKKPAVQEGLSPSAVVDASDMDSRAPVSTNTKKPAVREGLSPKSQERWQRIDQYLAEHTFDDMWEGMVAMKNGFCNPPKKVPFPNKKSSKKLPLPDSLQSPHGPDAQSSQTTTQCEESTAQIIENGKAWMKKEVMKAFKKYMKETDRFRGAEFELEELLHQCLSVETYKKIFHHYNFTVKTKQAGSDKWSSTLYFAQVKEMYGRKFYFCYPLDPLEDGICHACKNQGMDALKHPAVPIGYETGQADTGCPFFSQAFLGGAPY